MALLFSLILSASFVGIQEEPPAAADQDILVTGERQERSPLGRAEEPYPEVERVPLGSRIARRVARRPFSAIATESGVAGLIGSGVEATGGPTFNVRLRRITECVPEHDSVSEEIACHLYRVKKSLEADDLDAAAERLEPLMERRNLTGWERYYIGYYAFLFAEAAEDAEMREAALQQMLASERMEEAQRREALRALAGMALSSGRYSVAIERFEQLAELGADPRSLANLAALHDRAGRADRAWLYLSRAVATAEARGEAPAAEWTAYLGRAALAYFGIVSVCFQPPAVVDDPQRVAAALDFTRLPSRRDWIRRWGGAAMERRIDRLDPAHCCTVEHGGGVGDAAINVRTTLAGGPTHDVHVDGLGLLEGRARPLRAGTEDCRQATMARVE